MVIMGTVDYSKLKILMFRRGYYSQRELARRLRVKEWTLSKTIRGHRKNPDLVKRLARILKAKTESLMKAA